MSINWYCYAVLISIMLYCYITGNVHRITGNVHRLVLLCSIDQYYDILCSIQIMNQIVDVVIVCTEQGYRMEPTT